MVFRRADPRPTGGNALIPNSPAKRKPANRPNQITSLIDAFRFPRLGPGMMWEEAARRTKADGGTILMGHRATSVEWLPAGAKRAFRVHVTAADGSRSAVDADHVISSAPLRELVGAIEPFDDNWIYIHDPGVKVGRVQNFGSWSPELVPDPSLACYGLEYFCFEGDGLWTSTDADLVRLATSELVRLGLVREGDILDGHRHSFPDRCVVADFCLHLGIDRPTIVDRDANRSLSLPAVCFLFAYRHFFPASPPGRRTIEQNVSLIAALGKFDGPRFRFHPLLLEPVIREQGIHLDWLEARVGASLRDGMDDDSGPSIRSEEDLLDFSPESLDWLARRTGRAAGSLAGKDSRAVADAVDRLREIAVAEQVAAERKAAGFLARLGRRSRKLLGHFGRRSP